MSSFAIKYPFFILMFCLVILVVGVTTVARMPVDLFPNINIPVVVVATFYSGMPPEQIESDITGRFELAQIASAQATEDDIVLATDQAFYATLEAQATLRVAQQTESDRKTVADQITALTNSKLKSTLDQSFAEVALSQAQLLVLDAQNNLDPSVAQLNQIIGLGRTSGLTLLDDATPLPPLPPDSASLVSAALQHRPDLTALQDDQQAAEKFRIAQRDQMLPTVGALATLGATPVGDTQNFPQNWYGEVGLSVNVPIFNGFRYSADTQEAALRTRAAGERVRDLRDRITRDVITSALSSKRHSSAKLSPSNCCSNPISR